MAKYRSLGISDVPFLAGADYSASSNRYLFVALASGSVDKVLTGTGASLPGAIGTLQNSPCSGEEARVRMYGFSKLIVDASSCVINYGNPIICASDGQGEKQTNTGSVFFNAIAMDAITSGTAIIEVFLVPFTGQQVLAAS